MSNNLSTYPLPSFCFKVALGALGEAYFKSVSGIKYETEILPVKQGGLNDTTHKLMGATNWANLVLKAGYTRSPDILKWRVKWLDPKNRGVSRISGTITQLDTALKPVGTWTFHHAWPAKWEISEFDASKSELAIQTLELAHEGLTFSK
jgi:phage tail-like protein